MAWVKDVDTKSDMEEYLRKKRHVQEDYDKRHPPVAGSIEDIQKVIKHRERFGEPSFIECKEGYCDIRRVDEVHFDRDKGEAKISIDYGYYPEHHYILKLKNVMEITAYHPSEVLDVVWQRNYGAPTKYYPDYQFTYYGSMGKCSISEEDRGMFITNPPPLEEELKKVPEERKPPKTISAMKGLQIYCHWPDFEEYYAERKDVWIDRAKRELETELLIPKEEIPEEKIVEKSLEIAIKNYNIDRGCVK